MGIFTSFFTHLLDYIMSLVVVDDSFANNPDITMDMPSGLSVNIFRPSLDELPRVGQPGDIIAFRRMKVIGKPSYDRFSLFRFKFTIIICKLFLPNSQPGQQLERTQLEIGLVLIILNAIGVAFIPFFKLLLIYRLELIIQLPLRRLLNYLSNPRRANQLQLAVFLIDRF